MNPIAVLKRASFKNILKVIFIGLPHLHFILPTLRATKDCMMISTELYGRLHHKNGPANAFRHAFWNYLIAKRCFKWQKNKTAAVHWAKKITDWHESAFPNKPMAKRMDLHNNAVGRFVFQNHVEQTEAEVVEILKKMALNSNLVNISSNLADFENELVHITQT